MKKQLASLLAAVMLAMALAGCGSSVSAPPAAPAATTIKVTHILGESEVPLNPQRVVLFDFGALDTIDALGAAPALALPKSNIPPFLAKYKGDAYTDAGDFYAKDLEKINNFKPDLIILGARQQKVYDEMKKIAPTIVMGSIDSAKYMEDLSRNNLMIGEIFGKKAEAQAALAKISARIAEVRAVGEKNDSKALIVLTNDGNISAFGAGSRFGLIHNVLGLKPVDPALNVGIHGAKIGFEYFEEKNPDMIFVVDRTVVVGGTHKAATTLDNALVQATKAAKNGKIVFLDPTTWYATGNGLQSSAMMIEEIAAVLGM